MKSIVQYSICVTFATVFLMAGCGRQPEGGQTQATVSQIKQSAEYYTCPMHPSVHSDKPGACPICHMTLVKVSATKESEDATRDGESVTLSAAEKIRANIATTIVQSKTLIKEILAVGKIDVPENGTKQITARFGGRIERLFVVCCGQNAVLGAPVAELYSPDAIAAQKEFLVALNSLTGGPADSSLLKQTRQKLVLWGFTDQQLDRLAKEREPAATVMIYSPVSGTVLRKNVDLQQYVSAGQSLFDLADLRTVWLQLDIYQTDLAGVRLGQTIHASLDGTESSTITTTVSFISPFLDPVTRTARVRAVLDNSSGNLRPETYAHAKILVPLPKSLVVPASAIVLNGRSNIVWVEQEAGRFEPRQVLLGERSGEFYQILDGLHEGETVAARGAYLVDSESQLRQATAGDVKK